jgi:hypothetical protein
VAAGGEHRMVRELAFAILVDFLNGSCHELSWFLWSLSWSPSRRASWE